MKYWICKSPDGEYKVEGARGYVPETAIVEAPKFPNGSPVLDIDMITIKRKTDKKTNELQVHAEFCNHKYQEKMKKVEQQYQEQIIRERLWSKAEKTLRECDLNSMRSTDELKEVLFNILRLMGLK